jgi:hypothetical protein
MARMDSRWEAPRGVVAGCRPRGASIVLGVVVAAGCAGARPADPEEVAREERRLFAPFDVSRKIVADRFELTMTANFFTELAEGPLLAGLQDKSRVPREDGGTGYVYTNNSPHDHLWFRLGNTEFFILKRAEVNVLGGRNDLTLDASASGQVALVENERRIDVGTVRIAAGAFEPGAPERGAGR